MFRWSYLRPYRLEKVKVERPERPKPVREQRTIKEIATTLWGVAKENWLRKWCNWICKLFNDYNIKEDPQAVLGVRDLHNIHEIESFLLEHYQDLTEGEVLTKIKEMLKERGYKENVTDEMLQSMIDYWRSVKDRPEITYALPHEIASEVDYLREHPELDYDRCYRLVYDFLTGEGCDRSEAERIAREIAESVKKMKPEERKVLYSQMIHVAKLSKQTSLLKFMDFDDRASRTVEEAKKELAKTVWLIDWQERVFVEASKIFTKTMTRPFNETEKMIAKEEIAKHAATIDRLNISRSEAYKMIDKYAKDVVEYVLKITTPYEKVVEMIRALKPTIPKIKIQEIPEGPSTIEISALEARGVKLVEARHTKTVEETLNVLRDFASKNKLKVVEGTTSTSIYELPKLHVIYYPNNKPEFAHVDREGDKITIHGFDKTAIAYIVRPPYMYLMVVRK